MQNPTTLPHVGDHQGWPGDNNAGAARALASLAVSSPNLLVPSEKEGGQALVATQPQEPNVVLVPSQVGTPSAAGGLRPITGPGKAVHHPLAKGGGNQLLPAPGCAPGDEGATRRPPVAPKCVAVPTPPACRAGQASIAGSG